MVHDEGGSWETNAYDTFFQAEGSSSTAFLGTECFWPGYESGMLVIQSETKQLREEGSQDKAKNSLWLGKCTQYLTSPAPAHSRQALIYHEKLVHISMIKKFMPFLWSCLFYVGPLLWQESRDQKELAQDQMSIKLEISVI